MKELCIRRLIKRSIFAAVRSPQNNVGFSLTLVFLKGPYWLKLSENMIVLFSQLNCERDQEPYPEEILSTFGVSEVGMLGIRLA